MATKRIDQFDPKASLTGTELLLIQDPTSLLYNKTTLATVAASAAPVSSVAGKTGAVTLVKSDVGLSNVDNTADTAKPISTATQTALNAKANSSSLSTVATSGSYTDLSNKPTIPAAYTDSQAAAAAPVQSVSGRTGAVTLTKADVSLGNVDNTSDTAKPVSTATQTALNAKQDTLVSGTNIKTINGTPLLGSGDLTIVGGGGGTGDVVGPSSSTDNAVARYDGTSGKLLQTSGVSIDDTGAVTATSFTGSGSALTGLISGQVGLGNVDNTSDATKNAATATLTNKTLTSPKINEFLDTNGNKVMTMNPVVGAVNYIRVDNNAAGSPPSLIAVGTDTNISINVIPKNSGTLNANGVPVVTTSGTQTLTNKTLTSPKVDAIKDTNGNTAVNLPAAASAVNYVEIDNAATGFAPAIVANGTDANLNLFIRGKGTGSTILADGSGNNVFIAQSVAGSPVNYLTATNAITANKPTVAATGSDTNVSLNLTTKGTGTVQANAVDVTTVSGTQTLTNKTLTAPVLGGTVTGTYTLGGTPTFPAAVVQTTATQTLTNKTIGTGGGNSVSSGVLTNPYKFSVYRSAAQTVASGADTKVNFDTKEYDTGTNFDATTNFRFTAPVAGFYHFDAAVEGVTSGGGNSQLVLYKNGVAFKNGSKNYVGVATNTAPTFSDTLSLAANDTIEIYINLAGTTLTVGARTAHFSGFLVSIT